MLPASRGGAVILSDNWIHEKLKYLFPDEYVENRSIDLEAQLQPASIDLRLGSDFVSYSGAGYVQPHAPIRSSDIIDPLRDDASVHMKRFTSSSGVIVRPGRDYFVLGTTKETVKVPDDVVGRVEGRSSLGRLGLRIHSTAGFIDPGFCGQITLEIDAVGLHPIRLTPGMRICQLSFYRMDRPARMPYGKKPNSKYQNQHGAQPSRAHHDGGK